MKDSDYTYHQCNDLDFIIHFCHNQLLFDIDYKEDLLLIDLGDEYEVNLWILQMKQSEY